MSKRFVFALLTILGCGAGSAFGAEKLGPGDPAPPMKVFRWVKGAPITTFAPGKLYVVEFWATWCGPCKVSIPHLTELAKKYAGKVTFAGISVWEPMEAAGGTDESYMAGVRKFVKEEGDEMSYNVGADRASIGTMSDTWMKAANQNGIPTAFVVKDSKIAWIGHPMGGLDEALDSMLKGTFDYAGEKARESKVAAQQDDNQATTKLLQPFIAAMSEKRYKDAVVAIDKVMTDHPELADDLTVAKFDALARFDPPAANVYAKTVADGDGKSKPVVLNSIAWAMVDDSSPLEGMDYKLAETIAAQAVALLKQDTREYAETLDTLALAEFKSGKPGDAAATEKRAIELYSRRTDSDAATLKEMRGRLTKYESVKV